jgi:Overcoming lysogenization defect protein-like, TOPRIM domain
MVTRVLVLRNELGSTERRILTGALAEELAAASETLGLTRGELLLLTRLALFVEGPHDRIILNEWLGDEMRATGIRVFPVHGVDNLLTLVESEIVAALGMRIAVISDDTSVRRATHGQPATRGERVIGRLLREAAAADIDMKAIGLTRPDILWYLDEEICRQAASRFPGWADARAERDAIGDRRDWKQWITSRYGLSLTRRSIGNLAAECRRHDKIPSELADAMQQLAAYAAGPPPGA